MTIEFILIGTTIGLGAGFLLGQLTSSKNKSAKSLPSVPIAVQKPKPLPADIEALVQRLVDDGHKIGALKGLRDSTDLGLEEAKSIIDSMNTPMSTNNNVDKLGTIRDLIRSGNKIEALKLYRESSGMNLKEATAAIDEMEREFG